MHTHIRLIVVGIQYYHVAKLVIEVSLYSPSTCGYENLREARKIEVGDHKLLLLQHVLMLPFSGWCAITLLASSV
jgi:hypothetical protein